MNALKKLDLELRKLEKNLEIDIARFANLLEPIPKDRDIGELEKAWDAAVSSRRRLSFFLKDCLRSLSARQDNDRPVVRKAQSIEKAITKAQVRLRYWGRFEALMLEQISALQRGFVEPQSVPRREIEVMDHVVTMFLDGMHRLANPAANSQSEEANDLGFHRDIALPMYQFSQMIGAAHRICLAQRKVGPLRFLDVGSGGGTKVLAATTCFDFCDGLEFEKSTVETGRAFLNILAPQTCKLIHGDALEFADYANYDAIYFYRPLVGFENMVALEERIFAQARPGTILLVAGELFAPDLEARGVQKLANHVYVTGMSKPEAETLNVLTNQMGTMVPGYGRRPLTDLGYWQPLYEASARNGYYF